MPRQTPFSMLGNPPRLADFPIDEHVAHVLSYDPPDTDDQWVGPVYASWDRFVVPELAIPAPAYFDARIWYEWHAEPGNRERFAAVVREEFLAAKAKLEGLLTPEGRVPLLGVLSTTADLSAEVASGSLSFPDAFWVWDLEKHRVTGPMAFTAASFIGTCPEKGATDWHVLAEFDQEAVDWATTYMMVVGYYDFERQIVLRDGAQPARVTRVWPRPKRRSRD